MFRQSAFQLYKKIETAQHQLNYLFLELTRICNLSCLHCGSDCQKSANTDGELSTESWFRVIDYICSHFSDQLIFNLTGGEALLHRDFFPIARRIQSHGFGWGLVSNGFLTDKKCCDRLIDAGLKSLTLSIDGMERSHNRLRNHPQSYKRVIEAASHMAEKDCLFDVVTCVYPGNFKSLGQNDLDDLAQTLIDLGVRYWRLFRIFPNGRALDNRELQLSFDETAELTEWIAQSRPLLLAKGLKLNMSCEGYLPFQTDRKVRDFPFFCRAGINVASILCDGTITGCPNNDSFFHVGNIFNNDFVRVWEENFDAFRKRDWVKDTDCVRCREFKRCQGGSVHLWHGGQKQPNFCYVDRGMGCFDSSGEG